MNNDKILDVILAGELAVLMIEHHMDVVTAICDRVVVLSYGEIIAEGEPHAAMADPKVISAYLGARAAARHTARAEA